uniref:Uncharacterized protein n=1 Tax=Brassica oleracea var. oleracea TaxID=109376 RepID=A0A0D2ZXX2_BRAOL
DLSLASQATQEEGSEAPQANKAAAHGKFEERRFNGNCDHCKKHGHKKSQCWILHPHLKPAKFMKDREARANASDGTSGAGTSKGKEIDGREGGDGKSLVAYTGAPSNRGNNDQEYLRRSDLDALIKLFKENGNTFGYSFGARAIENHKDLTRTDRMHESLINMVNQSRIANLARNDLAFKPSSILAHMASNHSIKPLVVDSGASYHMISDTSLIKNIVPMNG